VGIAGNNSSIQGVMIMTYQVNTYMGEKQVNSENLVISKKIVYEVLNKYVRNKRNIETQLQTKIS